MANNGWDREVINPRERPLSSDINTAQSQLDRSLREVLKSVFTARASGTSDLSGTPPSGFVGDGFKVRASAVPALSVQVALGQGFQYLPGDVPASVGSVVGLDDLSTYKPLSLLANTNLLGIPAGPAAGSDRYDIIEVRMNRVLGNSASRDVLDVGTGLFVSTAVNKTLAFTQDGSTGQVVSPAISTAAISYKVGVVAATGAAVEPAVTTGYVKIATIFSNNGNMTGSITKANIIDQRVMLAPFGETTFGLIASIPTGAATPPTGVLFRALPGTEVVVVKTAPPLNSVFSVYFIGGAAVQALDTLAAILPNVGGAGRTYSLETNFITVGTLSAGEVTALADATLASPAATYAAGTPMVKVAYTAYRQQGATTDNTVPDPLPIRMTGTIQRY